MKAMNRHAWELWAALTWPSNQELNGQKVPVFETWWDADEALLPPQQMKGTRGTRQFRRPVQFRFQEAIQTRIERLDLGSNPPARPPQTLFDEVKYSDEIKQFIAKNEYYDHSELDRINNNWPKSTPVQDRKLKDFPDTSVMVKPVFRLASGTGITILPYWAGPVNSTTPSTPGPNTWTKKMAVVPEGMDPSKVKVREGNADLPSMSVNDFYNLKLTKEEAAVLPGSKEGDYMLLVGMHVSSREIDNWTWQTFWWSFVKPAIATDIKDKVKPPFDHYQVAVGYSFMTGPNSEGQENPDALPLVCYNPYLEARFGNNVFVRPGQLGIESNCMSCHRCAAWPATTPQQANPSYVANGLIDPGDPTLFGNKTKTDFLWGVADGRP